MGVYITIPDVTAEFKSLTIGDTTNPLNTAKVNNFIAQTEAVVTGVISKKYTVPIDPTLNPLSYAIVQKICIGLTAGRIQNILRREGVEKTNADEINRYNNLMSEARSDLNKIDNNKMLLPDAGRTQALNKNISWDKNGTNGPVIQKSSTNYPNQW